MPGRGRWPIAGALSLALIIPGVVQAETPRSAGIAPKVVIVSVSRCCPAVAWPQAERKTADELKSLGVQVERIEGRAYRGHAGRAELAAVAIRRRAACAVRLVRIAGKGVGYAELWLKDPASTKVLKRALQLDIKHERAVSIVALRIVELIRSGLMELNLLPFRRRVKPRPAVRVRKAAPPRPAARPRPPPVVRARPTRFGLALRALAAGGPGGAGIHGLVGLAGRWTPLPSLSLEVDAAASAGGQRVELATAKAAFHLAWVRLAVSWELVTRGRVRPALGLGGGVAIVWVRGLGAPGYRARSDATVAADFSANAGLAVVLHRHLWLRLAFGVSLTAPRITVIYAGAVAARFGWPYLWGSLGLEVRLSR